MLFPSVSSSSTQNPNSLSVTPESEFESTILSFLSLPDSPFFSDSRSFDRVLHGFLSPSGDDDPVQDQLIDRTLQRVSLLLESTKGCFRKRRKLRNSITWPLPPELTIKVFSLLDTKSLMQVTACCTMFNKCAMDPFCFSHIDLTTASKHADDGVLRTMIHRAGKELRSLKLGHVGNESYPCSLTNESYPCSLTSTCLAPLLSSDRDFTGNPLRSLHLYNLVVLEKGRSLCAVLSACSNLTDLKIVGLPLDLVLESLTRRCRSLKHLFLENCSRIVKDSTLEAFVTNCPNLTSITIKDCKLNDAMVRILVKGFRKLRYMNLSNIFEIDGSILRDLGRSCEESRLETIILRNSYFLKEAEVLQFLNSLIAGDFRFIRYIDVSSRFGLICGSLEIDSAGCGPVRERVREPRNFEPKFPLAKLKEERSYVTFVAKFGSELPM